MPKQIQLIDSFFIPKELKEKTLVDQYNYLNKLYKAGAYHILLNNVNVFGPFPRPEVSWDISEAQKVATYNPEVTEVLNWIKTRIVINLGCIDYKTVGVLIRIATGMLNKCNIPRDIQILFHDNMVKNIQSEHANIVLSDLPFLGWKRKRDSYSLIPTIRLVSVTSL